MSASSKIVTVLTLAEDQLQLSIETRTNTIFPLNWLMYEVAFCLVYFCSTFSFSRNFALLKIVMTFAIKLDTNEINIWTFAWIHQSGWGCTCCACQPAIFEKDKTKSLFYVFYHSSQPQAKMEERKVSWSVYSSGRKRLLDQMGKRTRVQVPAERFSKIIITVK